MDLAKQYRRKRWVDESKWPRGRAREREKKRKKIKFPETNSNGKEGGKKEKEYGIGLCHYIYWPLILTFNVQEYVFIHEFSQISLPWEEGIPPPLPHLLSLSRFGPPLTNPGCTTITGISKGHKGPCSP